EPSEAMVASMPLRALEIAGADHIVSVADMGPLLARLSRDPAVKGESMSDPMDHMPQRVAADMHDQQAGGRRGEISTFTCPECGGSMWQVDDDKLVRFRCHTGHAFYGETLLQEQADALEAALWTAVRIFKERMVLAQQLAARERARNNSKAAERFDDDAHNAERYSNLIHEHLLHGAAPPHRAAASSTDAVATQSSLDKKKEIATRASGS